MAENTPNTPPLQRQPAIKATPEPQPPSNPGPRTDTMSPVRTPGPNPPTPRHATPGPSTPRPGTPGSLRRALPSATASPRLSTPFPPRTPRTPSSGTGAVCTTDVSLFRIVSIHTAKCTECDQRNKAIMRRCPGCTFQVCTPCFEKREKEGRGLRHGIAMSSSASPVTARAVRRRIGDISGGGEVEKMGELRKEVKNEGGEVGAVDGGVGGEKVSEEKQKEKVKVIVTPKPKKRAIKKQKKTARFVDTDDEDDDELSSELSDPENGTPTPSKRRCSALTEDGSSPAVSSPRSEGRRHFVPSSAARYRLLNRPPVAPPALAPRSSPPAPRTTVDPMESTGVPLSKLSIPELMAVIGVTEYDEPLLGRRQLVTANPTAMHSAKNTLSAKPRPTAVEHQKKITEKVSKKLNETVWRESAHALDATPQHRPDQPTNAPTVDDPYTVRMFVETEAEKYRDDDAMDEDENKALTGTLESEALSWGTRTFRGLAPQMQSLMRGGLNVRLDLLPDPDAAKNQLAVLLKEKAAEKLRSMEEDRA